MAAGVLCIVLAVALRAGAIAASSNPLAPVSTAAPDPATFPSTRGHRLQPARLEVAAPTATNKFWANWVVDNGAQEAIYPMPYTLKWGHLRTRPELQVSHQPATVAYGGAGTAAPPERIHTYSTQFSSEISLGAVEDAFQAGYAVVEEGLFGVRVEIRGPPGTSRAISFPVFSGMAYVSARYSGGFTPRVTSDQRITAFNKVRNGVWSFRNGGGKTFRVYVLDAGGKPVDNGYNFGADGRLNLALEGWVRTARVLDAGDEVVLDAHASAVIVGCELRITGNGLVHYDFRAAGLANSQLLHWAYAHHIRLMETASSVGAATAPELAAGITPMYAPTKGRMRGVVGNSWSLRVDTTQADRLGFLPEGEPEPSRQSFLQQETAGTLSYFQDNWRAALFKGSFYFSGKGFQKVGMVCLLAEKFFGAKDTRTLRCADILADGFRCLYDRASAGDCTGAPVGHYYDQDWGGIPSREGYHDDGCFGWADFGNACYNDHHYHYGYFVVAASILLRLRPELARKSALVDYVDMLIRDTTNPSRDDSYFPRFRSFDWFDLHSWSRGVVPSRDGKDQESTSEELNLLYGIHLWGDVLNRAGLKQLGTTMLAFCAVTVKEFFLMQNGNEHHPADFVGNRVTGIFFQNRAFYSTWFGNKQEYIHGIQMLPLTPALLLTRTPKFCQQEWDGILRKLPLDLNDPWTSILLSGNLAIIEPDRAYSLLSQMDPGRMDDGLTRVWALYWAAVMAKTGAGGSSTSHLPRSVQTSLQEATTTLSETVTRTLTTQSSLVTTVSSTAASATSPTTEIPCHKPITPAVIASCGHAPKDCDFSAPGQSGLFTADCLHGGLGCNAGGRRCCRFCGFAQYRPIACPAAGSLPCRTTTPPTTTATATRTASTTTTSTSADNRNPPCAGLDSFLTAAECIDCSEASGRSQRYCGFGPFAFLPCGGSGASCASNQTTTTVTGVTVSRNAGKAPTTDEVACGHPAAECVHPWGASLKFASECMQGGLGCNALGKQCCRYCGFGAYLKISCDLPTGPSEAASVTAKTPAFGRQCSHAEEECAHPWGETMYATTECLVGGLGCNALGHRCCRYCGFGAYVGVPCPQQSLQARSDSSSAMLLAMPQRFALHSRQTEMVSTSSGNRTELGSLSAASNGAKLGPLSAAVFLTLSWWLPLGVFLLPCSHPGRMA